MGSSPMAILDSVNETKQCVILIGGRGTRLGDRVASRPKPLLNVGDRPFLSYLLHEVGRHGFRRIILLAGYKADVVDEEVDKVLEYLPFSLDVKIVKEPSALGTGGALKFARDHLDHTFLMMNGDSLFDINYLDLAGNALDSTAVGWIALKHHEHANRYGSVDLDGSVVTSFAEKSDRNRSGAINGGVYWLDRSIINHIGDGNVSLETQVFPELVRRGLLRGKPFEGFFLDIGVVESLNAAQDLIPQQILRPAVLLDCPGVLTLDGDMNRHEDRTDWMPGAIEAVRLLNESGYYVFALIKESHKRGSLSLSGDGVGALQRMSEELAAHGAHIDEFIASAFHLSGTVPKNGEPTASGKPAANTLSHLLSCWPVQPDKCFHISNTHIDDDVVKTAATTALRFGGGNLYEFASALLKPSNKVL